MVRQPPKLSDRIRETARLKHLSIHTERSYLDWIKRYYLFNNQKDPSQLGLEQIRDFLTHLAVSQHVSPSTQNQALCALLFLYKDVLHIEIPRIDGIERPRIKKKFPVVFTKQEIKSVLSNMSGTYRLIASLLYGSGLRLTEGLRLRVKDLDFNRNQILVRDTKGQNARMTMLPITLKQRLLLHLKKVELLHQQDLLEGFGSVYLPYAGKSNTHLLQKHGPGNLFFPLLNVQLIPRSKETRRHPSKCLIAPAQCKIRHQKSENY